MYSLFMHNSYINVINFFLKYILIIYIFNIGLTNIYQYLCSLTENTHQICVKIVNVFYFYPMFVIIYIIHNIKINKQLSLIFFKYNNPSNIYLTVLLLFIYTLLNILSILNYYISYLLGVLSYVVYISQICYDYIPINKLEYTNYIDFLNKNIHIFIPSGFIITYILIDINIEYYILMSYVLILLNSASLIYLNLWINYKNQNSINIILPFEIILSKIIEVYGKRLLNNIKNRKVIIQENLNKI